MNTFFYPRIGVVLTVIFDGLGGTDSDAIAVRLVPRSASVQSNSFLDADTWELEIDWRSMPLHPNIIRSVAARIYLYDESSLAGRTDWARDEFELVRGLADEISSSHDSNGSWLHLSGRDYAGLLINTEWDAKDLIPSGKTITATFQDIIDKYIPATDAFAKPLRAVFESNITEPVVGAGLRGTKKTKGQHVKSGSNVWDAMFNTALQSAMIAFVRGDQVVITEPRIQTVDRSTSGAPFVDAPLVVYGRDLLNLNISRRFARDVVPVVVATSYDPGTGRTLRAQFPDGNRDTPTALGVNQKNEQTVTAPPGITDIDILKRYAQMRSDLLGRAETETTWSSYSAFTESVDGSRGDLLRLLAGQAVNVQWDPFDLDTAESLTGPQIFTQLQELGYSDQVAAAVATGHDRLRQWREPLYVKTAGFDFDVDAGIAINVACQNYAYVPRDGVS